MSLLLDVIVDDRFYRQLRYPKRGFPTIIDGKAIETYKVSDFKAFAEEQLPSLKGKNWSIIPSVQRI